MKAGDTVRLKSGGPTMTISSVEGNEAVCDWFNNAKVERGVFKLAQLEPAERNTPTARFVPLG